MPSIVNDVICTIISDSIQSLKLTNFEESGIFFPYDQNNRLKDVINRKQK